MGKRRKEKKLSKYRDSSKNLEKNMSTNKFDALITSDDSDNDDLVNADANNIPRAKLNKLLMDASASIPEGNHRLQSTYCLWYSKKASGKSHQNSFDQNLQLIGSFATCEKFWQIYCHLVRPGDLAGHSDYHLFKHGIRPMWEDKANKNGGKWIVRLKKGLASRCWENLILAMLGEQFMVGPEVCGAVVSLRYQEDIISIWNRNASDQATTSRIRDTLRRVLNLPQNTIMEYKAHMASLNDHSSYRNTDIFVR